jgi:hypothetical protein
MSEIYEHGNNAQAHYAVDIQIDDAYGADVDGETLHAAVVATLLAQGVPRAELTCTN